MSHNRPAVAWCHLNDEADTVTDLIPGAVQVSGSDEDEDKIEKFDAFQIAAKVRVLVTKPRSPRLASTGSTAPT